MTLTSYAQNFEDVILLRALRHVECGTYVDIGAQDPVVDSVSHAFYQRGWRGVHVEPVAAYAELLRSQRPDEKVIEAAITPEQGHVPLFEIPKTGLSTCDAATASLHEAAGHVVRRVTVPSLPLSKVLDEFLGRDVHWLKIDVAGAEAQVIGSWLPSPIRPWIVVIESRGQNEPGLAHPAWEPHLLALGYDYAYFDGQNRFYVSIAHPELKESLAVGPNLLDDFVLADTSPFVAGLRSELSLRIDEVARLGQKLTEAEERIRSAASQDKAQRRRITVLEQQLSDIRGSYAWSISAPLRSTERVIRWSAHQTMVWTSVKPGSRLRKAVRGAIVGVIRQVLKRPSLAAFAKRIAARIPAINDRLRLMTYHQRAMSFIAQRRSKEDGPLSLSAEPQSVRLVYQRLMRARGNLERLDLAKRSGGDARPRLAFVSPLPPEKSGIADYSAELIPELARYYEVEVIVAQEDVSDPWIKAHCLIRDLSYFERNAHGYDRIIYHFGNSLFHDHMLRLLDRYPGVVVLHDFYLGGLIAHLELYGGVHGLWASALYQSHGYNALRDRFDPAKEQDIVNNCPVNLPVLQNAQGVIVHSKHSAHLAETYYGAGISEDWSIVPFPRRMPESLDRDAARKALGFDETDFVICTFGILGETKMNQHLLDAWLKTAMIGERGCHLIFVGQDSQNNPYCERLRRSISASPAKNRIRITGFVSPEVYRQYLQAADIAVQLRALSRGETSAAVFDCLAYGVPTIVNSSGSMIELPEDSVIMLPDQFSVDELADAIMALRNEPEKRQALTQGARRAARQHSPDQVARQYHDAIERISRHAPATADVRALAEHASLVSAPVDDEAWLELARKLAAENPVPKGDTRQLLVDVSVLARKDFKTGIQRVVRSQLLTLLNDPPIGFRVEPVMLGDADGRWQYRYARRYTLQLLGLPDGVLEDDPVEVAEGDILYMPDFWADGVVHATEAGLYADWRARGVRTNFMIHDILPLTKPQFFPSHFNEMHAQWLNALADSADRLVCISQAVVDDTRQWLEANRPEALKHLDIMAIHHGADIAASAPSTGLPDNAPTVLKELSSRPSFLMVGTVEPRKGHLQTLAAFEHLWAAGSDLNLVIVGAEGWKGMPHDQRRTIPTIVDKLRNHAELGKRLFWLEGISDEYLEKVYATCICLIAASEDEGFGLPLIEAARHRIPILARDIPVFREVAGAHAGYFDAKDPDGMAQAIRNWLMLHAKGEHPRSDGMPWLTWAENVERLKTILLQEAEEQGGIPEEPIDARASRPRADVA
ncbi:FkbM family methyltransferase [Microvirga sp. 2MCAF35]|uniref:FkbM family methyltransferase n=1 Tax=Microvirga sp. 2MCAF35 TaxID=3232987 RepID=UPI003F9BFC86